METVHVSLLGNCVCSMYGMYQRISRNLLKRMWKLKSISSVQNLVLIVRLLVVMKGSLWFILIFITLSWEFHRNLYRLHQKKMLMMTTALQFLYRLMLILSFQRMRDQFFTWFSFSTFYFSSENQKVSEMNFNFRYFINNFVLFGSRKCERFFPESIILQKM